MNDHTYEYVMSCIYTTVCVQAGARTKDVDELVWYGIVMLYSIASLHCFPYDH